jgi:cyclopropane fatty-acyl-phospholipid synthase-like methyltransferase
MFGEKPSDPARNALDLFQSEGVRRILELGGGQGRDSNFFGQSGLQVTVLDYSENGVKDIARRAEALYLSHAITALRHDLAVR